MLRSLSVLALLAAAVVYAPPSRADDAPKPEAPATGKPVDPIVSLLERLKDDQPLDVRLAALKEAATTEDARLVTAVGKLLKADEEDVRLAAVTALAACRFAETKRKAALLLLERSKVVQQAYEKDVSRKHELLAIFQGLHDLAQEATIDGILDGIEAGIDLDVVGARAMAVANVPSAKAIDGLISYMARRHRDGTGIRGQLTKALTYATGVKGANDDDAWRSWWKDAKATFDFQAAFAERERVRAEKAAKAEAAAKRAADGAKKAEDRRKKKESTPKLKPPDGEKPVSPDGEKPPAGEKPPEGDKPADGEKPPEK